MKYSTEHPVFTAILSDDYILVRVIDRDTRNPEVIPTVGYADYDPTSDRSYQDRLLFGEVYSAGPGRYSEYTGQLSPMPISGVGDEFVLFFRSSGERIEVSGDDGPVTYALIRAPHVVGVYGGGDDDGAC